MPKRRKTSVSRQIRTIRRSLLAIVGALDRLAPTLTHSLPRPNGRTRGHAASCGSRRSAEPPWSFRASTLAICAARSHDRSAGEGAQGVEGCSRGDQPREDARTQDVRSVSNDDRQTPGAEGYRFEPNRRS